MTPDTRGLSLTAEEAATTLILLAAESIPHGTQQSACLLGAAALRQTKTAEIVALAGTLVGCYSREYLARAQWAEKTEPWAPESKRIFETVLARESETRDAALALGAAMGWPDGAPPVAEGETTR